MNLHPTRLGLMPLFRGVPAADLTELCQHLVGRSLVRGEELYTEGAPARDAALVLTGRLSVRLGRGKDARVIAECWPGDLIGEAGLFDDGGVRNAGVLAVMESDVALLRREMFLDLPHNKGVVSIERHLLASMARRIRAANTKLEHAYKAPSTSPAAASSASDTLRKALLSILGTSA